MLDVELVGGLHDGSKVTLPASLLIHGGLPPFEIKMQSTEHVGRYVLNLHRSLDGPPVYEWAEWVSAEDLVIESGDRPFAEILPTDPR